MSTPNVPSLHRAVPPNHAGCARMLVADVPAVPEEQAPGSKIAEQVRGAKRFKSTVQVWLKAITTGP